MDNKELLEVYVAELIDQNTDLRLATGEYFGTYNGEKCFVVIQGGKVVKLKFSNSAQMTDDWHNLADTTKHKIEWLKKITLSNTLGIEKEGFLEGLVKFTKELAYMDGSKPQHEFTCKEIVEKYFEASTSNTDETSVASHPSTFCNSIEQCGCCGGKKVSIRGKYPQQEKRLICPTCTYERLEQIHEMTSNSYGVAFKNTDL